MQRGESQFIERAARPFVALVLCLGLFVAASCGASSSTASDSDSSDSAISDTSPWQVMTSGYGPAQECSGTFVSHDLPHVTSGPGDTSSTFDGTGAGLAAGDLDGDGDDDLVIANLSGATSILENTVPDDAWVPHELIVGRFRGVAIVDLDADGHNDIVMTTGIGPPVSFMNLGTGPLDERPLAQRFERGQIAGIKAATYSLTIDDLGGDGDLDFVTGSYNAELSILRNSPVLGSDTGVVLYERTNGETFEVTRLSPTAQALAMITADIDGDGQSDIIVGNDLATPDFVFVASATGWRQVEPFSTTSYSTMSYDAMDIDGDGQPELFTTDMMPMADASPDDYRNVNDDMDAAPRPDDIQTPENVLHTLDATGNWINRGREVGVEATGWSWSGLFGDLDNDGRPDVFVVNGMRSDQLFDFLPDARLVERNQVFRNTDAAMIPMPEWNLDDPAGGRGAVLTDFDLDGDLDIAVNNLDEPARLFENQLCEGFGITVSVEQLGANNRNAIGTTVTATTNDTTQTRRIATTRGYLSAGPPTAHFGVGDNLAVDVAITLPDGRQFETQDVPSNSHTHFRIEKSPVDTPETKD